MQHPLPNNQQLPKNSRIKIAFFAEILIHDFDGAARTMFQLLNRIPGEQFEFLFVCGMGPDEINGFRVEKIPTVGIPVNRPYRTAIPWGASGRLRRLLRDFEPQVVHIATPSWLGNFALQYAEGCHIPVISIYHTHFISYVQYYLRAVPVLVPPVERYIARQLNNFYNRCTLVYVPSESMRRALEEWGVAPEKMTLWQRGIDADLFNPSRRNVAAMQQLCGNSKPVLLFASRLVWEKNLETLIGLYRLLEQEGMPYNLVVAGDGAAMDTCRVRMPLAVFTGHLPHVRLAEVYASCDVFVFTSVSESYGNVVLEAMASGLPCVIANGGGSADFIRHGDNGYLCHPNAPADFLHHIHLLMRNTEQRQQFRAAGLAFSHTLHWEALADRYFSDLAALSAL